MPIGYVVALFIILLCQLGISGFTALRLASNDGVDPRQVFLIWVAGLAVTFLVILGGGGLFIKEVLTPDDGILGPYTEQVVRNRVDGEIAVPYDEIVELEGVACADRTVQVLTSFTYQAYARQDSRKIEGAIVPLLENVEQVRNGGCENLLWTHVQPAAVRELDLNLDDPLWRILGTEQVVSDPEDRSNFQSELFDLRKPER